FSSRRRHTRCYRDWSSDVCSSDLGELVCTGCGERFPIEAGVPRMLVGEMRDALLNGLTSRNVKVETARSFGYEWTVFSEMRPERSEERRVGKECRSRRERRHRNAD